MAAAVEPEWHMGADTVEWKGKRSFSSCFAGLKLTQPFFQVADCFYWSGVDFVQHCQIVACPVPEEDCAHHLAQEAFPFAVHDLMPDLTLLQKLSCYVVARQGALVQVRRTQHHHEEFFCHFPGEFITDHGIMIELGEGFVKSPGFAVFVELSFPASGYGRKKACSVKYRYFAIKIES